MRPSESRNAVKRFMGLVFAFVLVCVSYGQSYGAATLSPTLQQQLNGIADNVSVGVVIISFNTSSGLTENHLNILRGLNVSKGVTYPTLGMVGAALNAGQVRALASNPSVRSIWSNDRQIYHMNQARVLTGVDKLRTDGAFTLRNGGMPVSGAGDFSVFVIDSGIDATHADLPLGTKVIQNTQRVVSTDTGNTGITWHSLCGNRRWPWKQVRQHVRRRSARSQDCRLGWWRHYSCTRCSGRLGVRFVPSGPLQDSRYYKFVWPARRRFIQS